MADQTPDSGPEFPQDSHSHHNEPHDSGGLPQIASVPVEEDDDEEEIIMPDVQISQPPIDPGVNTGENERDQPLSEPGSNQSPVRQQTDSDLPSPDSATTPDNEHAADPNTEPVSSQDFLRGLERDSSLPEVPDSDQASPSPNISYDGNSSENVESATTPDRPAPYPTPSAPPQQSPDSSRLSEPSNEPNGNNRVYPQDKPITGELYSRSVNPTASPAPTRWSDANISPPVPTADSSRLSTADLDMGAEVSEDAGIIKILYVEDNPDNQILVQRVLLFEGFDIDFAQNAEEALELSENNTYDLILMDINLPDIDGYALTSILRKTTKFSKVPIIALTANVMKGDRERSLEAGCDGYIQKPVNVDDLPRQIKGYLSTR
jgi:two-component system cell cycle response regulator DivK